MDFVAIGKADLLQKIRNAENASDLDELRQMVSSLKQEASIVSDINQILESKTIERAKYYLKRLEKGLTGTKTSKINDINLLRWKEYDDIITDSLWMMEKRDSSGAHTAGYWGNFIPQIPHQLILRYTKKGDWVLDCFSGGGTTLIECKRLGRNGIGVELNEKIAKKSLQVLEMEGNPDDVQVAVVTGDSTKFDFRKMLGGQKVQLLIMHPPYHNIIKFSKDKADLSNAKSVGDFLEKFGQVVENTKDVLEPGRHLALVIGDKYHKGEWVPLGFYCMNEILKRGYKLKSIIVKNFEETRAKRKQKELWRYRALVGGFYVFKHEYIMIFVKP